MRCSLKTCLKMSPKRSSKTSPGMTSKSLISLEARLHQNSDFEFEILQLAVDAAEQAGNQQSQRPVCGELGEEGAVARRRGGVAQKHHVLVAPLLAQDTREPDPGGAPAPMIRLLLCKEYRHHSLSKLVHSLT